MATFERDEGHRNITKSEAVMTRILEGLGFSILQRSPKIGDRTQTIECGCIARKSAS
jgi:hypothetical protein